MNNFKGAMSRCFSNPYISEKIKDVFAFLSSVAEALLFRLSTHKYAKAVIPKTRLIIPYPFNLWGSYLFP